MNRTIKQTARVCLYGLLLSSAGCSEKSTEEPMNTAEEAAVTLAETASDPVPVEADGGSITGQVNAAVADLASRQGIAIGEVQVTRAAEVEWPSSALGCPQPDRSYTQALVKGLLVVLKVGDEDFYYHSGGGRSLFLCPRDRVQAPAYLPSKDVM